MRLPFLRAPPPPPPPSVLDPILRAATTTLLVACVVGSAALVWGGPLAPEAPTSPRETPGHRTRAPWRQLTLLMAFPALVCCATGMWHTAAIFVAAGFRLGPMRALLSLLPVVRDPSDYEDRRIRVLQSISLVSFCCGIYSAIPDHARTQQGWKQNLVTMETSMASGIAATYGYSVAGGIPGGLLAEYVMSYFGKHAVPEVAELIGMGPAKAIVSASLFAVMGMHMEWLAICGYAYAHRKKPGEPTAER